MSDAPIALDFTRRRTPAPRDDRHNDGNHRMSVRLPPALRGELLHASDRWVMTESEIVRAGLTLLLSGYPALPPSQHDWLLRLAAANDLHADPQAALVALLGHLSRRYPAAGRLVVP